MAMMIEINELKRKKRTKTNCYKAMGKKKKKHKRKKTLIPPFLPSHPPPLPHWSVRERKEDILHCRTQPDVELDFPPRPHHRFHKFQTRQAGVSLCKVSLPVLICSVVAVHTPLATSLLPLLGG